MLCFWRFPRSSTTVGFRIFPEYTMNFSKGGKRIFRRMRFWRNCTGISPEKNGNLCWKLLNLLKKNGILLFLLRKTGGIFRSEYERILLGRLTFCDLQAMFPLCLAQPSLSAVSEARSAPRAHVRELLCAPQSSKERLRRSRTESSGAAPAIEELPGIARQCKARKGRKQIRINRLPFSCGCRFSKKLSIVRRKKAPARCRSRRTCFPCAIIFLPKPWWGRWNSPFSPQPVSVSRGRSCRA